MAVSIREVADRAGVSRATVSKVLNGGRERISAATQERVRIAASELGYRPNAIARSLRRRRTDVIGFYSGYATAFWQVENIQRGCETYSKDLLIHCALRSHSPEVVVQQLQDGKIDGLIVIAPTDDPLVRGLAGSELPVVALADAAPGVPSVIADDRAAGRLMAEHLAGRGHKRVFYRGCIEPRESAFRRLAAFQERAGELGLEVRYPTPIAHPGELSDEEIALLTAPPGQRCTGVACWNYEYQVTALRGARRLGLQSPGEVSVVGVGDTRFDPLTLERLNVVYVPWADIALKSVEVLVEKIEGKEVPLETVIPVALETGETASS